MSQSAERFVYNDLPDASIRLLEILRPGDESERLALRLKTYRLTDAPAFSALSYVWGQSSETHTLSCSSEDEPEVGTVCVTSNLLNALPFIKAASSRPLWVDAICIDQSNDKEKARVVPMMGEYFSKAAEVLIWLGPSGESSDLAMDLLNWLWFPQRRKPIQQSLCGPEGALAPSQLDTILDVVNNELNIRNDTARLACLKRGHILWSALADLFQREWFFRVWTFQEALLATNATVLCGNRAIPWTAFRQLGLALSDTQLMWINRPGGPDSFSPIRDYRDVHQNSASFLTYLWTVRHKSCRFKEDRIYGMLALAPSNVRAKIPITYCEEDPCHYTRVYRTATIVFLEELSMDKVLMAATCRDNDKEVPSWCPDWSIKPNSRVLPLLFRADSNYYALKKWSIDPSDQDVLHIDGLQIDSVEEVIDDYSYHWPDIVSGVGGPADMMAQWLDRCAELTLRTICKDEERKEALWKTLLAYSDHDNPFDFPPDPVRGLVAHRHRLGESRDSIPLDETTLTAEDLEALGPLIGYSGLLWRGKVFYSTKGGTVGIADKGIAVGDSICAFFGSPRYFVISPSVDDTHSLRSVAYVFGAMGDFAATLKRYEGKACVNTAARTFMLR